MPFISKKKLNDLLVQSATQAARMIQADMSRRGSQLAANVLRYLTGAAAGAAAYEIISRALRKRRERQLLEQMLPYYYGALFEKQGSLKDLKDFFKKIWPWSKAKPKVSPEATKLIRRETLKYLLPALAAGGAGIAFEAFAASEARKTEKMLDELLEKLEPKRKKEGALKFNPELMLLSLPVYVTLTMSIADYLKERSTAKKVEKLWKKLK